MKCNEEKRRKTRSACNCKTIQRRFSLRAESNYKVPGITYRKAGEGATAILVDYNHEDPSNRELPIDVVIADSFE